MEAAAFGFLLWPISGSLARIGERPQRPGRKPG